MKVCLYLALCTALAVSAAAQTHQSSSDTPSAANAGAEVFGGLALAGGGHNGSNYGFNGGFDFRILPRTFIVFDLSQFHDGSRSSVNSGSDTLFLVGPRYLVPVSPRASVFGQFLLGGDAFHNNGQSYTWEFNSDTTFALAVEGGFDYALSRHLSTRFHGGYVHGTLNYSTYGGPANPANTSNNRGKFSADVVYRF